MDTQVSLTVWQFVLITIISGALASLPSLYQTWRQREGMKVDAATKIQDAALELIDPYVKQVKKYHEQVCEYELKLAEYKIRLEELEDCKRQLDLYEVRIKELEQANADKTGRIVELEAEVKELRERLKELGDTPPPRTGKTRT